MSKSKFEIYGIPPAFICEAPVTVLRAAPDQKSTDVKGCTALKTSSGQFTAAIHIAKADRLKG